MIEIVLDPPHLHGRKVDYVKMEGEKKVLILNNGVTIAEDDCKTAHVPLCCFADRTAELAERLYAAYNLGGPIDRAGLTWDDKQVPNWGELVARAEGGNVGSAGVIAKWRAVAAVVTANRGLI